MNRDGSQLASATHVFRVAALLVSAILLIPNSSRGQMIIKSDRTPEPAPTALVLPFAFYTDSTDFAMGIGGLTNGWGQPQLFLGAAAFGSTNGSVGLYLMEENFRFGDSRLFLDSDVFITQYGQSDEYVDGNPEFPGPAGSNDSSKYDVIESTTFSAFNEFKFKYVLPMGAGKDDPIAHYGVNQGVLKEGASGGTSWNPMTSGRTFIEFTPFADWRQVHSDIPFIRENYNTFGLRLGARWQNTDFDLNPSRGNVVKLNVERDGEVFDSEESYTLLTFEYAHYIPLGRSRAFKQQVLAFNFWTVANLAGDDPPYYTGATLGGFDRLRAYPLNRFHDRNGICLSTELRLMLDWNPVREIKEIDRLAQMDWMQFVFFGEVGRVGSDYSVDELLTDMKWDVGVGLRVFSHASVLRVDVAVGQEGMNFWLMVGQSF